MIARRIRQKGVFTTELIVGIAVMGLLLACLAASLQGMSVINQFQWTRQRCTAAACAQFDCLAATGRTLDESEVKRLWPDIDVKITRTAGTGPWEGLELLQISATGAAGTRMVTVNLERYVPKEHR